MPALGMAQETGQIVAWHKTAGDKVAAGDVLFEVETDKATMEVEAAGAGFLTDVRAGEGEDVPVGNVIALIADSPEAPVSATQDTSGETSDIAPGDDPDPAPEPAEIEGHKVIMPALGMAQDTGRIVAWAKAPGDGVAQGDVLFEVETDKATMEVEADRDGYLAAILALDGEEAPVGGTIAVISAEKPADPVARSIAQAKAKPLPASEPETQPAPQPETPAPHTQSCPDTAAPPVLGGRVLASPKARRLAAERGLDLTRLAEAGHPQPYHAADLDRLAALPPDPVVHAAAGPAGARQRIEARVPGAGLAGFADWLAETDDPTPARAALAALAAGALRVSSNAENVALRLDRPGHASERFVDADLTAPVPMPDDGDGTPDLILRDLTGSRLTALDLGPAPAPVLTVAGAGTSTNAEIEITLDFMPGQIDADTAVLLVDGFAARLEDPLRQLF